MFPARSRSTLKQRAAVPLPRCHSNPPHVTSLPGLYPTPCHRLRDTPCWSRPPPQVMLGADITLSFGDTWLTREYLWGGGAVWCIRMVIMRMLWQINNISNWAQECQMFETQ